MLTPENEDEKQLAREWLIQAFEEHAGTVVQDPDGFCGHPFGPIFIVLGDGACLLIGDGYA